MGAPWPSRAERENTGTCTRVSRRPHGVAGRIPKLRRGEGRGHRASAFSELMANGFVPSDGKSSAGDRRQSNDKSGGLPDLKSSGGPWCTAGSFWLRGGCVSCRDMPRFAIRGLVKSRDWRGLEQLITQRSLVQIQPPQPRRDKGLAVAAADPFVVSATILQPLQRVSGHANRAAVAPLAH